MDSIDTIAHLLGTRKFEKVLGVYDFNIAPALLGECTKIRVLSHNTPRYRVLCEDWGGEYLLHHNHYMTSFLDNIALVTFATAAGAGLKPARELYSALARRFFAEQLFVIKDTDMARVLFIETILEYDEHLRPVFDTRKSDARIESSSKLFTAMAADFLLHHELGHAVSNSPQFDLYKEAAFADIATLPAYKSWSDADQSRFRDEVAADLFSLTVIMTIYSRLASAFTIKSYIRLLLILVTRMQSLYESAAELYRINVDPSFDAGDTARTFTELAYREFIMANYVETLKFGEDTVVPLTADDFLALRYSDDDLFALTSDNLTAPITNQSRRLAEAISRGFEPGAGFADVIAATRQNWVLERRGTSPEKNGDN